MLPLALMCWVILLQETIGKVDAFFPTLSTSDPKVQEEIVGKFNEIGRNVEPTTGNMLKIVWNPEAARNARSWAEQCTFTTSPPNERTIENASCNEVYYMSTSPRLWLDIIHLWYSTLTKWYSNVTEFQYGTRVMNTTHLSSYNQVNI
ncbi:cysteine-rich venom protein natrin-1-like [Petaurus breviceps papuanus]|uniref:cysteine-rich venom protein natrin-1-like n=1 Tax=Petaurus breviceps papuanus TaxID=3040969 RepID=UPI0036D7F2CF